MFVEKSNIKTTATSDDNNMTRAVAIMDPPATNNTSCTFFPSQGVQASWFHI